MEYTNQEQVLGIEIMSSWISGYRVTDYISLRKCATGTYTLDVRQNAAQTPWKWFVTFSLVISIIYFRDSLG